MQYVHMCILYYSIAYILYYIFVPAVVQSICDSIQSVDAFGVLGKWGGLLRGNALLRAAREKQRGIAFHAHR